MGLFWKSASEKTAEQWRDPDCHICRGRGRIQGAGNWMENCSCVNDNIQRAAQRMQQQAAQPAPRRSYFQSDDERAAFARMLNDVPPDELTSEEFHNPSTPYVEVRKFLILVSHKADLELWQRVKAKQITRCCLAQTCFCTLNYYDQTWVPRGPYEQNALAWIRYWTQWLTNQPDESIRGLPRS